MTADFDIENSLKRFRHEPSARVKHTVTSTFRQTLGGREPGDRRVSLWKRSVPLYAAAAALLLLVGLSFALGRMTSRGGNLQLGVSQERFDGKNALTLQNMKWVAAENDFL